MVNTGYIKIFRSIMDKGWYKDSECVALWLHLILKANHKGAEFMFGYSIIKLLPGQLVTGRKALSQETGIKESKIERILKMFEIEQQIEQQTNSRNRIITIVAWDCYQKSEQQMDSPRTAGGQQVDTNKNKKNNKNEKNEEDIAAAATKFYSEQIELAKDSQDLKSYRAFVNYLFLTNPMRVPQIHILKLKSQLTYEQFTSLLDSSGKDLKKILEKVDVMINTPDYLKNKQTIYFTINKWLKNNF